MDGNLKNISMEMVTKFLTFILFSSFLLTFQGRTPYVVSLNMKLLLVEKFLEEFDEFRSYLHIV